MTTTTPARPRPVARAAPRIPFYWWLFWMLLLAIALFVFYVVFTPAWITIRLAAKLSEQRARRR